MQYPLCIASIRRCLKLYKVACKFRRNLTQIFEDFIKNNDRERPKEHINPVHQRKFHDAKDAALQHGVENVQSPFH